MSAAAGLAVQGLTVALGDRPVLHAIDLQVEAGEVVVLAGLVGVRVELGNADDGDAGAVFLAHGLAGSKRQPLGIAQPGQSGIFRGDIFQRAECFGDVSGVDRGKGLQQARSRGRRADDRSRVEIVETGGAANDQRRVERHRPSGNSGQYLRMDA